LCGVGRREWQNLYLNLKRYCKVTGDSLEGIIPKTFLLRAPLDDEVRLYFMPFKSEIRVEPLLQYCEVAGKVESLRG
jgi:hypothetical protein